MSRGATVDNFINCVDFHDLFMPVTPKKLFNICLMSDVLRKLFRSTCVMNSLADKAVLHIETFVRDNDCMIAPLYDMLRTGRTFAHD